MAEDTPNFDHRALQESMVPPIGTDSQQFGIDYPETEQFLHSHRHNGTDAERIDWTDISSPLPASAAAYLHCVSNAKSFGPSTWTLTHPGTGQYTITHNLGSTNYAMFFTPITTKVYGVSTAKSATATTVTFYTDAGVAADTDFLIMIMVVPFNA